MSIESRFCDNFWQLDGMQCSNNAGHRYGLTMLNMQSVGRFFIFLYYRGKRILCFLLYGKYLFSVLRREVKITYM